MGHAYDNTFQLRIITQNIDLSEIGFRLLRKFYPPFHPYFRRNHVIRREMHVSTDYF